MKKLFLITFTLVFVISCGSDGGSSGSGSSGSGGSSSRTYTPSYTTNLGSVCPASFTATIENGVVDFALPSDYTNIDLNDFTINTQTENSGVVNYESSTTDLDYDSSLCGGGETWARAEISMFGTYNSATGTTTGTFTYEEVCTDNGDGSENKTTVCSGSF